MNIRLAGRGSLLSVAGLALALSASLLGAAPIAPPPDQPLPSQVTSLDGLSIRTWADAKDGNFDDLLAQFHSIPAGDVPGLAALRTNAESLEKNLAKREDLRSKKLAELNKKFDEQMKKADEAKAEESSDALSDALKTAVETFLVVKPDAKDSFKHDARITDLVRRADTAARENEKQGKWFKANELFYRLHLLLEEEGTYKPDTKRLGLRLSMIRMYAPEEFWKLRNDERLKEKKSPLPPYNGLGEDFREKLDGVDSEMVRRAVLSASRQQIDTKPGPNQLTLKDLLLSGIDALRTLTTTSDLKTAFPSLGDKDKADQFVAFLDDWQQRLKTPGMVPTNESLRDFMDEAVKESAHTIALGSGVVLHEFGNGAMSRLDDFSAIIWPDEVTRFNRMTEGKFRGVGVQIQLDEESQMIKVVSPLEGTPAQRAGIKTNDLIKKIDGRSAVGISLNQAVDLITGPVDSTVTMTMERKSEKTDPEGHQITQDIDFKLARKEIDLPSVKGWRHVGTHENEWDWMIDPANRIGYIRLLQFTDNTTVELRNAIEKMQAQGPLNGLIFDLRFNPGGLLTEAVGVANTFIDRGVIVSTEGPTVQGEVRAATPGQSLLKDTHVVCLINEGSASASEIVSGAIRHYADKGDIKAIVLGQRSYGKGSVQNVWPLTNDPKGAKMKLTTQYYKLPDGHILHRKPGSVVWGVEPHLKIDELSETVSDAIKLRTDADVVPIDEKGKLLAGAKTPDPQKLLDDGLDLQLQAALAILQTQAAAHSQVQARMPDLEPRR